jgi:hypothetical protein
MSHTQKVGRTMQINVCAISAIVISVILGESAQSNLQAQERFSTQQIETPTAVRLLPQEAVNRYAKLNAVAQPSVKAWIESQARVELQRPSLDTASLNAAIQNRFGGAAAKGVHSSPATAVPAGMDIDALAFMVLMQAANDQNQDLQEIMNEMQARTKAKQALRNLLNQLQRDVAANANQQAKEVCATAECRSIAQEFAQIESLTAQTGHPVRFNVSDPPTYGQLRQAQTAAGESLDGLSDMSNSMQMKIQMEQAQYSQVMEAISNIEKKMNDTSTSIIQNMK